jgi:3-oxoacyl-[acyl-carrier-protein] synthase III
MPFFSYISGTGSAFPVNRVSNFDLANSMRHSGISTSDAWIRERTGISERRIVDPENPDETNSSLGLAAARRAIEMAGKTPEDIDQIVYATSSPDTLIPSTACWLQHKLSSTNAWAMDINAACSGFVYALCTADQFIRSGQIRTALVVGAEVYSAFVDWKDRNSAILFGDGAGAVILERAPSESGSRIIGSHLVSDGNLWNLFQIPAGGSNLEVTPERYAMGLHKIRMNGKEIFKAAVRTLTEMAATILDRNGFRSEDLAWLIPHQANIRIIHAISERLKVPMEKLIVNLDRFGNTSSATIPTALDEAVRDGRVQRGDLILFAAFGAGMTAGTLLLRY